MRALPRLHGAPTTATWTRAATSGSCACAAARASTSRSIRTRCSCRRAVRTWSRASHKAAPPCASSAASRTKRAIAAGLTAYGTRRARLSATRSLSVYTTQIGAGRRSLSRRCRTMTTKKRRPSRWRPSCSAARSATKTTRQIAALGSNHDGEHALTHDARMGNVLHPLSSDAHGVAMLNTKPVT